MTFDANGGTWSDGTTESKTCKTKADGTGDITIELTDLADHVFTGAIALYAQWNTVP